MLPAQGPPPATPSPPREEHRDRHHHLRPLPDSETYEDALAATREARRDLLEGTTAYVGRLIRQALPDAGVLVVDLAARELLEVADRTGGTLWYAPTSAGHGLPDSLLETVNRVLGDALDFGGLSDEAWGSGSGPYRFVSLTVADVRLRRTARACSRARRAWPR